MSFLERLFGDTKTREQLDREAEEELKAMVTSGPEPKAPDQGQWATPSPEEER